MFKFFLNFDRNQMGWTFHKCFSHLLIINLGFLEFFIEMSNYVLNNGSIKGDMSFDNVLQFSFRYFLQYLMEISYCGSKVYPRGFSVGLILVQLSLCLSIRNWFLKSQLMSQRLAFSQKRHKRDLGKCGWSSELIITTIQTRLS